MFLDFYKLKEEPFGVTPDPRFLYMGPKHREALASLLYGTESNRGFLAMIAEPGMGKTSLLHEFLSQYRDKARTAFVFRTDCDSREFIHHALLDLGIDVAGMDVPTMHEALNRVLSEEMQAGRRVVLVVDEAQNLDKKTLESIRLLSNFEAPWMKLMVIVLAGQPQLANKLDTPSLSQLRQRISMVIRIEPLTHEEVNAYIDHRLLVAGGVNRALFTVGARKLIAEHSKGIPRGINNICFNAMSLGCALRRETIDRDIVSEVIADLDLSPLKRKKSDVIADAGPASLKKSEPVAEVDVPLLENNEVAAELHPARLENKSEVIADLNPATRHNIAAPKPDKKPTQTVPVLSYPAKGKSNFGGWLSRLAVASMLFLSSVGSAGQVGRVESRVVDLPTTDIAPVSGSLIPTKTADTAGGAPVPAGDVVHVMPGQTLYRICFAKFGKYNDEMFEKIRVVNPWMRDPNLLDSGRDLLIPSSITGSEDVQRAVEDASSAERVGTE
jgi:type II secretory pathway predicted ATPase ExeA